MANPKAQYPPNTIFGARIQLKHSAKQTVAEEVKRRFLGHGQSVFISDGSSTFFVGLSIFGHKIDHFRMYTNSLPIAHEFPLWCADDWPREFCLKLAGGKVNSTLMMTGEEACEASVSRMAEKAQWTIISTRYIFGKQGPAGVEPDSLAIKQAAIKTAPRVVLICDDEKLSNKYTENIPLVYDNHADWEALMARSKTYVVTTLPDGQSSEDMHELGRQLAASKRRPKGPLEQYAFNTWPLRLKLDQRFVEI